MQHPPGRRGRRFAGRELLLTPRRWRRILCPDLDTPLILRMGTTDLELGGERLGELRDSTALRGDAEALRARFAADQYLLLRGFHPRETVAAARRRLCENLAENGQLDPAADLMAAKAAPGASGQFLGGRKAVSHTPELLAVVRSDALMGFYSDFFGAPSLTFDYKWIRAVGPGANTGAHYDVVYMGRGTRNLITCWTPLGDIDYTGGPLAVWEGSQHLERLKATYGEMDVDRDNVAGHFSGDPLELVERYGGRWLTTEFRMGDILMFGMFLMHGSLNNGTDGFRLSCDTRYQRADEPVDERWVGENPKAHYAWGHSPAKSMEQARAEWGV